MTNDSICIEKYLNVNSKNYNHWVFVKTNFNYVGKKNKKEFKTFCQTLFSDLGEKWQYQTIDSNRFIIKFKDESDMLFFMLRYYRY